MLLRVNYHTLGATPANKFIDADVEAAVDVVAAAVVDGEKRPSAAVADGWSEESGASEVATNWTRPETSRRNRSSEPRHCQALECQH